MVYHGPNMSTTRTGQQYASNNRTLTATQPARPQQHGQQRLLRRSLGKRPRKSTTRMTRLRRTTCLRHSKSNCFGWCCWCTCAMVARSAEHGQANNIQAIIPFSLPHCLRDRSSMSSNAYCVARGLGRTQCTCEDTGQQQLVQLLRTPSPKHNEHEIMRETRRTIEPTQAFWPPPPQLHALHRSAQTRLSPWNRPRVRTTLSQR